MDAPYKIMPDVTTYGDLVYQKATGITPAIAPAEANAQQPTDAASVRAAGLPRWPAGS
jgi:hypothetical protein